MFDKLSEKDARNEILKMVKEYCTVYHAPRPYSEGDRIAYAKRVYDEAEMVNLVDSALEFWLTAGKYTATMEKNLAQFLNTKHVALVNSGSSANLLAFMALTSPLLKEKRIRKGDEVITVAAAFPTTVSPIVQYGAVPVFVDITIPQYNIDISQLEVALSPKSKAVMLAHTLGNPFNIKKVKEFCTKNNLWLIEDNCDSLGSKYCLDGNWSYTGTFGDIATLSFYPPHHMTMGEGGAVYTNDSLLNQIVKSLRDWGRDCSCPSGVDNICGHRFDKQYGELPLGYDHKYVYSHFGYNLKVTDMQSAIGCAQLEKLPHFIEKRKENHSKLYNLLKTQTERFVFPQACENSEPSWFGFMLTCIDNGIRNSIVQKLEKNGIQTRMLFSGNITKHPCFIDYKNNGGKYRIVGDLKNTDKVMDDSFWVGVYPGLTNRMIDYMVDTIINSLE